MSLESELDIVTAVSPRHLLTISGPSADPDPDPSANRDPTPTDTDASASDNFPDPPPPSDEPGPPDPPPACDTGRSTPRNPHSRIQSDVESPGRRGGSLVSRRSHIISAQHREPNLGYDASPVTTPRCQQFIAAFQRSGAVPSFCARDPVLAHIRRTGVDALLNHKFEEAEAMRRLHSRFLAAIIAADGAESKGTCECASESKVQASKDHLSSAKDAWQARIRELIGQMEQRLREIRGKHRRQLREFTEYYDQIENLKDFAKPSGSLLKVRAQEKALVLCNRFKEARMVQTEGNRIERLETDRGQRWVEASVSHRREALLATQQREIDLATQWFDQLVAEVRQHMAEALETDKLRVKFLNREAHQAPRFYGLEGQEPYGVATPRTASRMLQFRASAPVKPLRLMPLTGLAQKAKPRLRVQTVILRQK